MHPAYHRHVEIISDYLLDHRYRKQEPVDWLPKHAYHRPLAAYINGLAEARFQIERVLEIHQREADAGGVPGLLYVRAVETGTR